MKHKRVFPLRYRRGDPRNLETLRLGGNLGRMIQRYNKLADKSVQVQKQCGRCKEWKDKREFHKDKYRRDGLTSWCRECVCERVRERYAKGKGFLKTYLRHDEKHRVVDGVRRKLCSKCGEWKDESSFYKCSRLGDGLSGICKECSDTATNQCRRKRVKRKALSCMGIDQKYAS